jgi:hypothetical protein
MIITFEVRELQKQMIDPPLQKQTIRMLLPNNHLPTRLLKRRKRRKALAR